MNRNGIALYLGMNYVLVFVLAFVALSEGLLVFQKPNLFQYLLQAALMGIPALCGIAAAHLVPDTTDTQFKIWPLPIWPSLLATVFAPVLFAVSNGVAWAFGLTHPQWSLGGLVNRALDQVGTSLSPGVETAAPIVALVLYPIISIVIGATLFAFIAAGSEIGWRGYLQPRLLPMGRLGASLVTGVCWALWFFPLVYGWFREADLTGIASTMLRCVALAIVLSVLLGNVVERTRHLGVAAMLLGGFVGQAYGIWPHLFEQATVPWTGAVGWINIGVWGCAAAATSRWKAAPQAAIAGA